MTALDAAAFCDAPEQLIGPKREIARLSSARIEGLVHCVRARSIRALGVADVDRFEQKN